MPPDLAALRSRIRLLERPTARPGGALPFGVPALDMHLPEAGLAFGALHEVMGGGGDEIQAASAALFVAGILGRLHRPVLWCAATTDLFPPGLACAGLHPDHVLHVAAPHERDVLPVMEEALRHTGLAAVVGELSRLPMVASRRLVLAAEKTGVMAMVLRRRREGMPADAGLTAAATRWCITPLPSITQSFGTQSFGTQSFGPLPYPVIGRARWRVALTRCRGGEPAEWILEACDAQGCLALPADLAHRPLAAPAWCAAASF
jgi:protein ImuA